MSDWSLPFYYVIIGVSLLLTVMGLYLTAIMPVLDRWSKRLFIGFFSALLLCCGVSLVDMIIFPYHHIDWLLKALAFIESFSLSLPLPMLTAFIVHCRGEKMKTSLFFRIAQALWGVFVVLLSATFFTGFMYFLGSDGVFYRGRGFLLLDLPLTLLSVLNLSVAIASRKRLSRKVFTSFIIASLPLTITLILHAFIDIMPLVDISFVLSAFSMFG